MLHGKFAVRAVGFVQMRRADYLHLTYWNGMEVEQVSTKRLRVRDEAYEVGSRSKLVQRHNYSKRAAEPTVKMDYSYLSNQRLPSSTVTLLVCSREQGSRQL